MGRGDQYQQRRFTVPCSSGDGPSNPWPFERPADCGHAASRKFYYAPSRLWLCEPCHQAQTAVPNRQETR